ncbi:RidA family protein [Pseudonocardia sp. HH130630-07]|uniref:RidA family protein n=1 Tax=Pseudonocardia sp. HH130630-07 TaxID=1690815 RepID=UPI00081520AA|nr:RidA family protein [Pseudonocardia sp. HH130630-07]ANY06083.1 reactive intermediate/imine deaminase [Pseudonocardia sp. HH130630-07]
MSTTVVSTPDAPAPAHTFSQAIRKGGLLQVSGQGPMDPATSTFVTPDDVKNQTLRTLENIRAILEAGGASVSDVLMFRVYLTDQSLFAGMNEAYGEFVSRHVPDGNLPARTTVFVGLPHPEMLVEIDALAAPGA